MSGTCGNSFRFHMHGFFGPVHAVARFDVKDTAWIALFACGLGGDDVPSLDRYAPEMVNMDLAAASGARTICM